MPDYSALAAAARQTLDMNRVQGTSDWEGRKYDFVCPAHDYYPFQWLWDSAFHAICLLHVNPERAKQEIRCLLQGLQPDGFMPHMLLWNRAEHEDVFEHCLIVADGQHTTVTTQPPVIARAVERVYRHTKDEAFLREVLPQVVSIFQWLATNRDPDRDGLIAIIQPDESGLDASPKYDLPLGLTGRGSLVMPELRTAMQRLFDAYAPYRDQPSKLPEMDLFQVEDVMFNAIYGDGLRCLARLAREVSATGIDATQLDGHADAVTRGLLRKCWDDESGVFWDAWGAEEKHVRVLTITSLFPLILEDLDGEVAKRLVDEHLLEPAEFWTRYPLPSVAADEPVFDPAFRSQGLWRGGTWVNTNWYLYWGLRAHGYADVASELATRTFDMVMRGGMREFFNPLTAEGQGAQDFSWSALVLDLLWAEGKLGR
ncbi:MAG: hypothetical protein JO247_22675 [Chloroflexi bacterium]|nr:hypothetical protein [Chloroflexota bacterium]